MPLAPDSRLYGKTGIPVCGDADCLVGASHLSHTCHSDLSELGLPCLAFVNTHGTSKREKQGLSWRQQYRREGKKGGFKTRREARGTGVWAVREKAGEWTSWLTIQLPGQAGVLAQV